MTPVDDLHARLDAIEPSIQPYSIEWSQDGRPDVKLEAQPSALQLSAVHEAIATWSSQEAEEARRILASLAERKASLLSEADRRVRASMLLKMAEESDRSEADRDLLRDLADAQVRS